jgi:chromosome segregation ATPase
MNSMSPPTRTAGAIEGRRADTARRRERVLTAITDTIATGSDITAAAIAQRARVDRSFLYRHPDLLERLHAAQAQPPHDSTHGPAASLASLQADLLAAHERAARLHNRVQHLERRLSDALGERAWHASGLGAPADIDALHQQTTRLEQQIIDLSLQLAERDEDLAAARATNREFMARINASHPTR